MRRLDVRNERARLEEKIHDLAPWFHNMNLGGVWTAPAHPLGDYPAQKWRGFAERLRPLIVGRSVLDIGCNAGFHAIEAWRMGAREVVAIDHDPRYLAQARLAADVLDARITLARMSAYDVALLARRFDVVLFMGVFYHLRHPLLALDLIREHVTGDVLVFQSMLRGALSVRETAADYAFSDLAPFDDAGFPKLHFIEQAYAGDETNWWVPNRACAEALLRSAGFRISEHASDDVYICRCAALETSPDVSRDGAVYPARGPS